MSGDYIERAEFEKTLREYDTEIREHYDEVCGAAMIQLAETEKAIGNRLTDMAERLGRNLKWLIGLIVMVAIAYGTTAVTVELAASAEKLAAIKAQQQVDAEQNLGQLEAWRAIEKSAAIAGEHKSASEHEFKLQRERMAEIRLETRERVQHLEAVQREHEREKNH